METYTCAADDCGKAFTCPPTKGQRPRWCPDCRTSPTARGNVVPCSVCGTEVRKQTGKDPRTVVCGDTCKSVRQFGYRFPSYADFERAKRVERDRTTREGYISAIVARRDREALDAWLAERADPADGGCLVWRGRTSRDGYPSFGGGRGRQSGHRAVYYVAYGPVPKGDHVHHRCGNRLCVAPDHLALSTARENIAEMLMRTAYEARLEHLEDLAARMAARLDPSDPLVTEWQTTTAQGARAAA